MHLEYFIIDVYLKSCFIRVVDYFVNNYFPTFSPSSYLPPLPSFIFIFFPLNPIAPDFKRKDLKKKSKEMCCTYFQCWVSKGSYKLNFPHNCNKFAKDF